MVDIFLTSTVEDPIAEAVSATAIRRGPPGSLMNHSTMPSVAINNGGARAAPPAVPSAEEEEEEEEEKEEEARRRRCAP